MVVRAAQDPFGLGRLSQSIRQNRAEQRQTGIDEQQAVTRGLQQQLLGGQVQKQQQSLADLAAGRQLKTDLQAATQEDTGESRTLKAINFLKERAPDQAQELINKTIGTAGNISKFSPQGGIDFVNSELGTNWTLEEDTPETFKINQGDKISIVDKKTNEVIKEFPVTQKEKQLTPQQKAFEKLSPEQQVQTFLKSGRTIRILPGGGFEIIEGGGVQKAPKFTEVQSKSGGFADRVQRSGKILNDLEDTETFEPALLSETIAASIPLVGNALLSPEKQRYEQAKRDFVTAILRLESGAAISDSEFVREDKKFFPQVGDSPGVIAQKRDSRAKQFDILKAGSAGAFDVIQEQRKRDEAGETPKISNVDQFNALPSGTIYQQEDGQTFQKP